MKNLKKTLSLILALVFALSAFCGCSSEKGEKSVKIGIAAPEVTHGWVAGVAYYAEKYCKEQGIDYKITTSSDAAEMAANLSDLVTWGADAVILWPQWTGMEDSVSEIIDEGIPVVSFDVDIDCEGIYKVSGNNYDMGYQSAKYIAEKVGDAARIAVLDVPSVGSVSALRKQGFYDYLDETGYDKTNIFAVSLDAFTRDAGRKGRRRLLPRRRNVHRCRSGNYRSGQNRYQSHHRRRRYAGIFQDDKGRKVCRPRSCLGSLQPINGRRSHQIGDLSLQRGNVRVRDSHPHDRSYIRERRLVYRRKQHRLLIRPEIVIEFSCFLF